MNKTLLVAKREFLTRVRKRTFILSTILTPLLFVILIVGVTFLSVKNVTHEKIAVVDPNNLLKKNLDDSKVVSFEFNDQATKENFSSDGYGGLLLAPHTGVNQTDHFQIITDKNLSMAASSSLQEQVNKALERGLITEQLNIDPRKIDSIRSEANSTQIEPIQLEAGSELRKSNSGVAFAVGYASAFLIYITLFIYGTMVMRGVMEEKTNRIAEVVVSSVRPYQLMMGKITGIGAVGLTQFFIWILLIVGIITLASSFVPPHVLQQVQEAQAQVPGRGEQASQFAQSFAKMQVEMGAVNWPLIVFCFVFYFIGGYLFYAALFAAVGSSVNEDPQDAQSLLLPITMPIVFAIIIMINSINNPGNSLAVWSSMIPFFSPIVMMSRIPFGVPGTVPWWQLGLSMALLVAGFLFTTWMAAKIYRTGILMYGKKPTWKEMIKWVRRSA